MPTHFLPVTSAYVSGTQLTPLPRPPWSICHLAFPQDSQLHLLSVGASYGLISTSTVFLFVQILSCSFCFVNSLSHKSSLAVFASVCRTESMYFTAVSCPAVSNRVFSHLTLTCGTVLSRPDIDARYRDRFRRPARPY